MRNNFGRSAGYGCVGNRIRNGSVKLSDSDTVTSKGCRYCSPVCRRHAISLTKSKVWLWHSGRRRHPAAATRQRGGQIMRASVSRISTLVTKMRFFGLLPRCGPGSWPGSAQDQGAPGLHVAPRCRAPHPIAPGLGPARLASFRYSTQPCCHGRDARLDFRVRTLDMPLSRSPRRAAPYALDRCGNSCNQHNRLDPV
jgi:hypothetical protein